jgi:hypothetical protein
MMALAACGVYMGKAQLPADASRRFLKATYRADARGRRSLTALKVAEGR